MQTDLLAAPVPRTNLSDVAEERLRTLIIERVIAPGEPLMIGELSEAMQVSRTPLLTAIDRLVMDGLVERPGPGSGRFCVATSSEHDARHAIKTLGALFGEGLGRTPSWPEVTALINELSNQPTAARTNEIRYRLTALCGDFENPTLADAARRSLDGLVHLAAHPHRRDAFEVDAIA